jgi:hypothetical protein
VLACNLIEAQKSVTCASPVDEILTLSSRYLREAAVPQSSR